MNKTINCTELGKIFEFNCCTSCHDEWRWGFNDPMEKEFIGPDGVHYCAYTCCDGVNAIDEYKKSLENEKQ